MSEDALAIFQLLEEDRRYRIDAYQFVREALGYAQDTLRMGQSSTFDEDVAEFPPQRAAPERHLTGQDLCEAVRLYSLEQFGYMSRVVLKSWGLESTGDIGNVVYNLIRIGFMKKSQDDQRDHFDDVFDFQAVFEKNFQFDDVAL